jgi:nucleoside-diphosphate-sugar epimerase
MVANLKLAITGATGFVGGRLLEQALAAGHEVRALTRRPQQGRDGVSWITGALDEQASLDLLAKGADALIHVAGVINAPDPAGFEAGNVTAPARYSPPPNKPRSSASSMSSSLSAREAEAIGLWRQQGGVGGARRGVVATLRNRPAPGPSMAPVTRRRSNCFAWPKRGIVLLPPEGRLSLIHVDDLARLLLALAIPRAPQACWSSR